MAENRKKDEKKDKAIFPLADRLFGEEGDVSIRTLIQALPNGGSHRDVGRSLQRWKDQRIEFRLARKGFALEEHQKIDLRLMLIWKRATQKIRAEFDSKIEKLDSQRRYAFELRNEALALADGHLAVAGQMSVQIVTLRKELRAEKLLQRRRSEEFWDRVVLEIAGLMVPNEWKTPKEMLVDLDEGLRREARFHVEPLTEATIRKKILMREDHEKLFEAEPRAEGDPPVKRFRLRPDAKGRVKAA
ncbi:hypothetical protein [Lichenifustis flavocetrariae]|uniref:Uncharacterized protein n=1 Tax=Lichenifustis flavocetrariae TaxID=2949735 RepID=A0AA42CNY4_9HYPH|nr:hypothetical protein [Lichenifustis flavocetrariae]MCW6509860.1 hypothetical protein [Lichenifustis flavocetrariae]